MSKTVLYDKTNARLISIDTDASPEFWDKHWDNADFANCVTGAKHLKGSQDRRLKYYADKYLSPGAKIIDAGCGRGRYVYGFYCWGYDSYGVDTAKNTVDAIKTHFPEQKVYIQDVRNLEFENNFFDCYYSGGVIEHFWDGYDKIINEAKRVIKPEGYLIVTIPFFSPLRYLKAILGVYRRFKPDKKPANFYQFFLNPKKVVSDIEKTGFKNIEIAPYNEILGLMNEFPVLAPILRKIQYGNGIACKTVRRLINIFLTRFTAHSILFVFQKKAD